MIVKEIMTTELITVAPDDTLSHAANLLRQHQFHHLPVVRGGSGAATWHWPAEKRTPLVFEGLLTSEDIDMAVALERENAGRPGREPWQSRRVLEVMHRALIRVTPATTVAAAAMLLVERNLNCLPVIQYESKDEPQPAQSVHEAPGAVPQQSQGAKNTSAPGAFSQQPPKAEDVHTPGALPRQALKTADTQSSTSEAVARQASDAAESQSAEEDWREGRPLLVGLLTRSDLLIALARSLGVFEPGMQLVIPLRHGNMQPLARALALAGELRIGVRSVVAAPLQGGSPRSATLRLGTINPAPFLLRLQEEQVPYLFADQEV